METPPVSSPRIRILLIEDEEADYLVARALLGRLTRPPVDLERAASYEEAVRLLGERDYDLLLVDHVLGDGTGLELVQQASDLGVRAPMIMLTGKGSHELDVKAMRAGVADYLPKGNLDPETLERAIRYALDRHRSQEALRESEERLRTFFDRLPLGLYRVTPEGGFMDANPALMRLLGHPGHDALQSHYSLRFFVAAEDRTAFHSKLMSEGVVVGFESTLARKGGELIAVRNSARLHRFPDGTPAYIEGALEDVSDIARARRVHDSESHFRALVDATGIGVLLVTLDGTIAEVNPAASDIFSCPAEDLENQVITQLFDEGDRSGVTRDFASVQGAFSGRIEADRKLRRADGEALWARVTLTPVRDPSGEIIHLLCLLEDVAESTEPALGG